MRLILASASPRRQELLRRAGYAFEVCPAHVNEDALPPSHTPTQIALYLAKLKGDQIAARYPDAVTLAADTVVALADHPLGKPANPAEARGMIRRLSGSTHQVITGVSVKCPARLIDLWDVAISTVRMRAMTDLQIDAYVASGKWHDKAGGYGIQDDDPLVECIDGSPSNVIGLPMELTARLLAQAV